MSLRLLSVSVLFLFALTACQQAAWKAGAGAEDLKRDEQACRARAAADDAAIKECLRDKGWTITDFKTAPDADEVAAEPTVQSTAPAPAVTTSADATRAAPAGIESSATGTAAKTASPASSNTATAPTAAKPKDPMQRQSVQTWWKAGGQAADFDTDQSACLTQLGAQHTPDYAQHLYTRAMVNCLLAHGWHAGYDPVYTPLR